MPTGIVEKSGISGVETIFTILHAGGNLVVVLIKYQGDYTVLVLVL